MKKCLLTYKTMFTAERQLHKGRKCVEFHVSGWRRRAISRGQEDHFSKSFSEMSVPLLMDHIRVILWSFKNKWECMWKIDFFFYYYCCGRVSAILGKTSLPCFPELNWTDVRALSVPDSSSYYYPIPASQEPVFLIPDVRPLLPPAQLTSQRKKNHFKKLVESDGF